MDINFSALNSFRNLNLKVQGDKAILVDMDGRYDSIDTYRGPLSAMTRSEGERRVNNHMRENLMDALADAFGMGNEITETANGKRYSATLIDTLERHLGKDFKRADFGFTENGSVSSGRPLTLRRMTAILNKMENLKFNIAAHEKRLDLAQKSLDSMDSKSPEFAAKEQKIHNAAKFLQALKNDAKGEPVISYITISDEYGIMNAVQGKTFLTGARDFAALESHISQTLGISLDLHQSGVSEDTPPTEESAHKLNSIVMSAADSCLTRLLAELEQM